jgi:hypothetical protein
VFSSISRISKNIFSKKYASEIEMAENRNYFMLEKGGKGQRFFLESE